MKKFITNLVFISLSVGIFSQDYKTHPVHIGFAYPISTNGLDAENFKNNLSIHGFMGISAAEQGVCISGFYNNTADYVDGVQIAGFLNTVKNNFNGLQISGFMGSAGTFNGMQLAGFMNMGKEYKGFQLAGFMNNVETLNGIQMAGFMSNLVYDAKGVQISGFMNTTRDCWGGQFAGFMNRCQDFTGIQMAGFLNKTSQTKGFQITGFMNQASNVKGCQIAGFFNSTNDASGLQIAGFMNKAIDFKGVQIAGFMNASNNITGNQICGFFNRAKVVRGVQIAGIVNTADSSNFPIGFINVIRNGYQKWRISSDMQTNTIISFVSGGRYTYGILGLGYNFQNDELRYVTEIGYGIKANINKKFEINTEIISLNMVSLRNVTTEDNITLALRMLPTFKLSEKIEFFVGPTANILWTNSDEGRNMIKNSFKEYKTDKYSRYYYISGVLGVNYKF